MYCETFNVIRKLPALHVLKSRTISCTARKPAQSAMPTRCTELHGPASHCSCTALHGPASNSCCMALHGRAAAQALPLILQPTDPPFYRKSCLTLTLTTNLEVHGRCARAARHCTDWRTNCAARSCTECPTSTFVSDDHNHPARKDPARIHASQILSNLLKSSQILSNPIIFYQKTPGRRPGLF